MLASRLLSILMLLQARGSMSATELAAEFEVSVRTIFRDIDQLSAAGIPVYAERGRAGGFKLLDGYRTKLTGMTQSEAETLFLAGLPGPAAELGLADLLATARLKLMAALPATMQPKAERIAARFHLDPAGWFRGAAPSVLLPEIARAVWNENYLRIRYRSGGDAYARKLGPLGLVLKGGAWYLVAQSGKALRTYRASNIVEAEVLDETFARPKVFDLAAHWTKSSRDYEAGLYRESAHVRLSPKGCALLELLGPHVEAAARASASAADGDGWVNCTIAIEAADFGIRELMRLGGEIEVLAPAALRTQMARAGRQIAEIHAGRLPKRGS
jgi:predicted DNA-binding transcriptional regulator YafY